jgi:hypothetical protein
MCAFLTFSTKNWSILSSFGLPRSLALSRFNFRRCARKKLVKIYREFVCVPAKGLCVCRGVCVCRREGGTPFKQGSGSRTKNHLRARRLHWPCFGSIAAAEYMFLCDSRHPFPSPPNFPRCLASRPERASFRLFSCFGSLNSPPT